ncbi:sensor protein [Natrialba chahannaoensis JCM 10990]|uniref:Sensor protein n=1 Tax=Natrialba chahannaoensis JCM 10990 TaxID=1227492 RepID=M0AXV0_9EURY|nr:DICT sensory domain-containing protein [Natrialba chahannaoensis]ELZ03142.1 sensor protein [Natrialba chahannaoensis JCM 10990]
MTIEGLDDAFVAVERERKRLVVHAADVAVADELERQFATRNVAVDYRRTAAFDEGFVVIRDADGRFRGTLGIDQFDTVLSPETTPLWALEPSETEADELFDFLENTLFSSYDRRQMLAATREIEDRAWRAAEGHLYAGFQRTAALEAQREAYDRLSARGELSVTVFTDDDWDKALEELSVVSASGEIGQFWFVVFDGTVEENQACALVAEEREPGLYYGFWTYDPAFVGELVAYLEDTYDVPEA